MCHLIKFSLIQRHLDNKKQNPTMKEVSDMFPNIVWVTLNHTQLSNLINITKLKSIFLNSVEFGKLEPQ